MHCARRICIVSFTCTSGKQISTASIYLNSWALYMYIRLAFIYMCVLYIWIYLFSPYVRKDGGSELLLLDAEPLPPARVHCIIQFWSLAIKKRNKGRTIVLAHRHMDRDRDTYTQYSSHRKLFYVCSYSIDACVSVMIHPHKVFLAIFFKRCVYLW